MSCQLLAEGLRGQGFDAIPATDHRTVFQVLQTHRCEVGLVSPNLFEEPWDGVRFVGEIRNFDPEIKIVVLLNSMERRLVLEAFRGGALGIFCRSHSFEALCKCILCVEAGQVWASSVELQFLLDGLVESVPLQAAELPSSRPLSRREEEIAHLVAEGFSNRQISERLRLSEHTIKNYLFRVFEKLGVSTRVELTLYALRRGKGAQAVSGSPQSALGTRMGLVSENAS